VTTTKVRAGTDIHFNVEKKNEHHSLTRTFNITLNAPRPETWTNMEKRELDKRSRFVDVTYDWLVDLLKVQWYWDFRVAEWKVAFQAYGRILNPRTRLPYDSGWRAGDTSKRYDSYKDAPEWMREIIETTRPATKIVFEEKPLTKRELRAR
jgi:hypothetical protein